MLYAYNYAEESHPGSPLDILIEPLTSSVAPNFAFTALNEIRAILSDDIGGIEGPLQVAQLSRGLDGCGLTLSY